MNIQQIEPATRRNMNKIEKRNVVMKRIKKILTVGLAVVLTLCIGSLVGCKVFDKKYDERN